MRQRPFFLQEFLVDRQRREGIICSETELGSNGTPQAEDSRFLHSMQLFPKIEMDRKLDKRRLRPFEFSEWREKAQLDFTRAKFASDQAVKTELDRVAAHELLAHSRKSRFGCSPCRRQRFLVSCFVI